MLPKRLKLLFGDLGMALGYMLALGPGLGLFLSPGFKYSDAVVS